MLWPLLARQGRAGEAVGVLSERRKARPGAAGRAFQGRECLGIAGFGRDWQARIGQAKQGVEGSGLQGSVWQAWRHTARAGWLGQGRGWPGRRGILDARQVSARVGEVSFGKAGSVDPFCAGMGIGRHCEAGKAGPGTAAGC